MTFEVQYFMLNRIDDWLNNGNAYNFEFLDDVMKSSCASAENSFYFSQAFDSQKIEMVWHRLRLKTKVPQNTVLKLWLYASDNEIYKDVNINDYFSDKNISCVNKLEFFKAAGAKAYENPSDILLFDCRGKYLWLCMEVINYSNDPVSIEEIKLEFPRVSFIDYLPEIYRARMPDDMFLARFVGIFQSLYLDLNDDVFNIPKIFDSKTVDIEFLNWMCEWISLKDSSILGEKRLRKVFERITSFYRIKGSKKAISKVVELFIGATPIILEKFEIEDCEHYLYNKKYMDTLYGNDKCYFSVIIKNIYMKDSEDYVGLLKLINRFKPINAICNLVVLNEEMYLDHHCYLGMNSTVSENRDLILNDYQSLQGTEIIK